MISYKQKKKIMKESGVIMKKSEDNAASAYSITAESHKSHR